MIFNINSTRGHTGSLLVIHEGGCLVDEKLSLSRVKIVQHGPLTLCF